MKEFCLLLANGVNPVHKLIFALGTNVVNAFRGHNLEAILLLVVIDLLDVSSDSQGDLTGLLTLVL